MSLDPFDRWAVLQNRSTRAGNRLGAAVDPAFWGRVTADYDPDALANHVPAAAVAALPPQILDRNATGWLWPRRGRSAVIGWDALQR